MPYMPQAPPMVQIEVDPPAVYIGPPISEKPVTPVTAVTEILNMPLSRFATEGRALEVRVPWQQETLWFAPGLEQVGRLMARGVQRGWIWTAGELSEMSRILDRDPDGIRTLARIKAELDGELISVDKLTEP